MKPCQMKVMFSNVYSDNSSMRIGLCQNCGKVGLDIVTTDGVRSSFLLSPTMATEGAYGLLKAITMQGLRYENFTADKTKLVNWDVDDENVGQAKG